VNIICDDNQYLENYTYTTAKLYSIPIQISLKKLDKIQDKNSIKLRSQTALEDLDAGVYINSIWVTIRENINISAKESLGYYYYYYFN
jgi:GTP-binding protein EngB required for normal cell division